MDDDIVTRLRKIADLQDMDDDNRAESPFLREVAAEIERLRAVLNAIDAIHQSFTDPDTGITFCDECNTFDIWPCRTHTLLHPKEARRG